MTLLRRAPSPRLLLIPMLLAALGAACGGSSGTPQIPPPSAPNNLVATRGDTQVTLTWSNASGAADYNVYWATTSGVTTDSTKIASVSSGYVHTGRTNGTTYYYRVSAVNAGGEGVLSTIEASATPQIPAPAAPVLTAASGPAEQQVTVTWEPVSTATSYNLYWKTSTGVTTADTQVVGVTSPYTLTGLANGTQHWLRVSAVNVGGETLSNEVNPSTLVVAPKNLSVTGVTDTSVALSWTAVTGAFAYYIYWAPGSGVTGSSSSTSSNTTTKTVTGLTAGTAYSFRVAGLGSGGTGALSSEVATSTAPGMVYSMYASGSDQSTQVTWTPTAGAVEYKVYWNTSGNVSTSDTLQTVAAPATVWNHGSLTNGTKYCYRVVAVNSAGVSGPISGGDACAVVDLPATVRVGETLGRVVWGGTAHLTMAPNGRMLRSTDKGLTWTPVDAHWTAGITGLAYGSGRFVASTYSASNSAPTLISTDDGLTWTAQPTPGLGILGLAYGNGFFIGGADYGRIHKSTDGVTWTQVYSLWGTHYRAVTSGTYNNNPLIVAVGDAGRVSTSSDGTTWASVTVGNGTQGIYGAAVQNDVVLVTSGTSVWKSTNGGASFTATTALGADPASFVGAEGLFVTTGAGGFLATSPDGDTWTTRTTGTTQLLTSVAYDGADFLATGPSLVALTSPDGMAWSTTVAGTTPPTLHAVGATDTAFVAVGAAGAVRTSTDGTTWAAHDLVTSASFKDLAWGNGRLVGVLSNSSVATSINDGVTWSVTTTLQQFKGISYKADSNVFVATDGAKYYTSPDPGTQTWVTLRDVVTPTSGIYFTGAAGGNGVFAMVGYKFSYPSYSTYMVSLSDPYEVWSESQVTSGESPSDSLAFGAGAFVFGVGGSVYRAPTPPTATYAANLAGLWIRFTGGRFLRVGGGLYTSADGVAWTQRNPGVSASEVACLGTTCVFTNSSGLIASVTGANY